MRPLSDDEVRSLGEGQPLVIDGFLPQTGPARAALEGMLRAGALRPAAIGRGAARHHDPTVRGDQIAWLEEAPEDLRALFGLFSELQVRLNQDLWLGLRRFEVQVAAYPGRGEGYARHRDAFLGGRSRLVTAIVYLNAGWRPADGGCLRVFLGGLERDIEPLDGRLVLFLSEGLEHEVLPCHAPRFAVTAWYRGDLGV